MKKLFIILFLICLPLYASKGGTHGGGKGNFGGTSTLVITDASLLNGTVNVAYSDTVSASGGTAPYTWSSTTLPTGIVLNTSTGVFSGTPTVIGTYSFIVTVTDSSSPTQSYSQGFSIAIAGLTISISPTTLAFGNQEQNTTSAVNTVTLTNTGTVTSLTITSITASGDYTKSATTCGSSLAAGTSCTVSVTFTPTIIGADNSTLIFVDSDSTSPQTITLTGTGITT